LIFIKFVGLFEFCSETLKMKTKIFAVAALVLMAACQKNGGEAPQPSPDCIRVYGYKN